MFDNFNYNDLPVYNITVEQWDLMTPEEQEEYIKTNIIKVEYSTDISDTLSKGFGYLDQWGF